MKRWLPLALILLAAIGAIIAAEKQKIDTRPSADALLTATADAQHELTRIPARLDRMSDDDEVRLGDRLAAQYAERWKSTPKASGASQIELYLQEVGGRAAAEAQRKLPYRFHYIPEPSFVNAFALPGGHVFVGQGLLALMNSEDALAAVLGHEIEHIDQRHCAERLRTEAHLHNLGLLGDLLSLPVEIFEAGYSKDQELEADRTGTALAVKAGYSPQGILNLLDEFQRMERDGSRVANHSSPVDEAAQLSLDTLQGYFRSHPPAMQRKQQIVQTARAERWPYPPLRTLKARP